MGRGRWEQRLKLVDVTKLRIEYCNGCLYCRQTGKCRIEDDYQELIEKLRAANGIVLSSPNYMSGITAQLKTVFDGALTATMSNT